MKQHYFSQKDIEINDIRRIDLPVFSHDKHVLLSRPVICIFFPDGQLLGLMSLSLFRIRKKHGLSIISDVVAKGVYCELRQFI